MLQSIEKLSAGTIFILVLFLVIDQKIWTKKSKLFIKTKLFSTLILFVCLTHFFRYLLFLIQTVELRAKVEFLENQLFHLVHLMFVLNVVYS